MIQIHGVLYIYINVIISDLSNLSIYVQYLIGFEVFHLFPTHIKRKNHLVRMNFVKWANAKEMNPKTINYPSKDLLVAFWLYLIV